SQSFPSAGGAGGPVTVQTPVECQWTASSSDSWITGVTGGGSGPGQVRFDVAGNTGAARTGHLTIAGQTFTLTEGDCTYQIAATSGSIGSGGGPGQVTVTPSASTCPWTASTTDPWITGVTPSGTGPGQVTYNVQANSGPARTGHIAIAGQTFTLNQAS